MDKNITKEPVEALVNTSSIENLLQQSNVKLQAIGQSIDFLAAVMTGLDPDQIAIAGEMDPSAFRAAVSSPALQPSPKVDEKMVNINTALLEEIIEEAVIEEIMDLPSDLSTPAGPEEERMDALSSGWEKLIADRILDGEAGIWSNTEVIDPIDGERRLLDEFLAILGNYVVSDEIDEGDANDLARSIADRISDNLFEPSPHEWGIAPPKWEGKPFEPAGRPRRPEGLEEGDED